jgi:magnesium transporter
MFNPLILPELREMLSTNDESGLADVVTELHPATIAEFSAGLSVDEIWRLLDHASVERQAEVFAFFPLDKQEEMVVGVGRERMSKLLEAMSPDDRVDLLKRLDTEVMESLVPLVAKAERQDIRTLLSFPEGSVGAVMTTEYASVPKDATVTNAISRLRQQAPSRETIYYVYVMDESRRLLGFVSLRDLILAKPSATVDEIMLRDVISIRADQDQEEAARELAKYDFLALPVVDDQHHLIGIVTHDDVIDVMIEEATEDAEHMAGVVPIGEDYFEAPFLTIWRKRAVWLSCLFIAEMFTFTAMTYFEREIEAIATLALFVPLCLSTGGNSGSQGATLLTRALALGQITPRQWLRALRHELAIGIALALTLGAIGFLRVTLTPQSILGSVDRWAMAMVISQAVAAICLWGTLVGAMLPLAFKALGFDPGYASSPFVATFVDVTGIVLYFSIAKVYLFSGVVFH